MIRIVLVDENTTSHQNTAKWLRRIHSDITLLKAWDRAQALELIRTSQPHLLLTALPMRGLSGFELLAGVAETAPELPTIVFSEVEDGENSLSPNKVGRIGKYVFLRKPFDYSSLVTAIKLATEERPATSNTLASFVRLLKNERQTCAVSVVSNEKKGLLIFNNGVLVDAADGEISGEPAVLSLLGCKNPSFTVGPLESLADLGHRADLSGGYNSPGLRLPTITGSIPKFTPPQPPVDKWREYAGKSPQNGSLSLSAVLEPTPPVATPPLPPTTETGSGEVQKTAESLLNFADTLLNGDDDLDKVFELAPELKLRLDKGELPHQTASLLAFLDGHSTIREITKRVPTQSSALRFLISGLASTNLLREVAPVTTPQPERLTVPGSAASPSVIAPPAEPREAVEAYPDPIPERPFFTSSDALLLAQTLSIRFGIPPKNTSIALWGLSPARQTILARCLNHLAATQSHHLKLAVEEMVVGSDELSRIPFRAGLSLSVHGYPSNPVAAQRIPELESFLATILFLDAERTVSTEVINRLWVEYSNRFDKPCLINLFNQAFDVQPSVIDHFAKSLDLPTSLFGSWDITKPAEVADMISRLIQVGIIF